MSYQDGYLRGVLSAVAPVIIGLAFVYFSASIVGEYGWAMFVLAPFVMGFAATIIFAPRGGVGFGRCAAVSVAYLGVIAVLTMALAIEGLICILMSLPLAVPLSILGALIAWAVTNHLKKPQAGAGVAIALFISIPLTMGFEISRQSEPTMHRVVTTVSIDAPIDKVWQNVVAFPEITAAPDGILNLGFAYPVSATIDGSGVGAIRYCNFDTGPFVEPITAWQEPNFLAFDVLEQPAPMTELTPYNNLHTVHLNYIRSQKGQFRLYESGGHTILEGTTFYTHDIAPDVYWRLFSDRIIQKIHLRVLEHIKNVSESGLRDQKN